MSGLFPGITAANMPPTAKTSRVLSGVKQTTTKSWGRAAASGSPRLIISLRLLALPESRNKRGLAERVALDLQREIS